MMTRTAMLPSLAVGLVLMAGCSSAPTKEIEAAEKALDEARTAEAPTYAVDAWTAAEDAYSQMQAELKAQEEAFFLVRSYGEVKALSAETQELAEIAEAHAVEGKEMAQNDAREILDNALALNAEVQELLEGAPSGKGARADLAALRADASSTEQLLREGEAAYAAGDYAEAEAKAQSAIDLLNDIKADVEGARSSVGGHA